MHSAPRVADVLRADFDRFLNTYGKQAPHVYKVVNNITSCRTPRMGAHVYACDHCGHEHIVYNSCRDRHCPSCQTRRQALWVKARTNELLPVPYFHVVFTVPHELNRFAARNKKAFYTILFKAASETLLELAKDKKWVHARIGIIAVLHTWTQTLQEHPHVHCIVPGGGIAENSTRWKHCRKDFLFPVEVVKKVFRGKFMAMFRSAVANKEIAFHGVLGRYKQNRPEYCALIHTLYTKKWNVHMKEPFAGPGAVLKYLGRYTHRIAISDRRLVSFTNNQVTFSYRKRTENNRVAQTTVDSVEFIRRFLSHVLPFGFTRIRYYGFLSCSVKNRNLDLCRRLLRMRLCDIPDIPVPDKRFTCSRCSKGTLLFVRRILYCAHAPPKARAA